MLNPQLLHLRLLESQLMFIVLYLLGFRKEAASPDKQPNDQTMCTSDVSSVKYSSGMSYRETCSRQTPPMSEDLPAHA